MTDNQFILIRRCSKWQYQRERPLRQDVIREEITFGSLTLPHWLDVLTAVNTSARTDFALPAAIMMDAR